MPSKYRGEELRTIIKKIRDGTFEYESREPPETNWTQYDKAQFSFLSHTDVLSFFVKDNLETLLVLERKRPVFGEEDAAGCETFEEM
ncbi:MAG: hypothetical protein U9N48_05930 [Euryarchaeota archaeon]|nr:hypothetical protein [Euryarchaeota archaeon]